MSVTLKRAAYLKGSYQTTPGFGAWKSNGVNDIWRMETYIATVWKPPAANIKNVIVLSAGQQALPTDAITTGQTKSWNSFFLPHMASKKVDISPLSMAFNFILMQPVYHYSKNDTLLVLIFKSGLQYDTSPDQKNRITRSYFDWLKGLTNDFGNVDIVFLSGISRGGILAIRLGKMIREQINQPNMKVFISSIDSVPNQVQGELDCTSQTITNRLKSIYHAWYLPIDKVFDANSRMNLWLYHSPSGGWAPFSYTRTFASGPSRNFMYLNYDYVNEWGFYTQKWVDISHTKICTKWQYGGPIAMEHLLWFLGKAF
jgi:hypothetical protein